MTSKVGYRSTGSLDKGFGGAGRDVTAYSPEIRMLPKTFPTDVSRVNVGAISDYLQCIEHILGMDAKCSRFLDILVYQAVQQAFHSKCEF